jgi:hypothetical protein
MPFQLLTAIFAYIVTSRALPFVVGLGIGGMLTLSSARYAGWMEGLLEVWGMIVEVIVGP